MPTDPSYPIIFLPGIMGSRLFFPNSSRYWDPDSNWRMLKWLTSTNGMNRVRMHGSQPADIVQSPLGNEFNVAREARGWGGVVWSFYGAFLQFLERIRPNPVYAMGYDWRQDMIALGADVRDRVRAILQSTGSSKAVLITHSMGGLVVRSAFRGDPSFTDVIDKTIFICQPSAGAVLLHRRLFTGLDARYDSGWAFRQVLGTSRSGFLGNISGLPGAMELLPSVHFPLSGLTPWNPQLPATNDPSGIYADANNSPPGLCPKNIGLSAAVIQDLDDRVIDINGFHQFLGSPNDPATTDPAKTWLIYGNTMKTETMVQINGSVVVPVYANTGDQVVPDISANCLGLPANHSIAVAGITHETACLDATVQNHVQAIL